MCPGVDKIDRIVKGGTQTERFTRPEGEQIEFSA